MSSYALLGAGKTGAKVLDLVTKEEKVEIFNTKNPPTIEKLKDHKAIISFLPGEPFLNFLPMLVATGLPVITGSTGFQWPSDVGQTLKEKQTTWIYTHNFALGMNIIHELINTLSSGSTLFSHFNFKMHEVHHTKKLDAPSGTALTWEKWLDQNVEITSERVGDVVGDHELILKTEFEEISIKHRSLDRKIFANGALWATRTLLSNPSLPHGLLPLEELAKLRMNKELS